MALLQNVTSKLTLTPDTEVLFETILKTQINSSVSSIFITFNFCLERHSNVRNELTAAGQNMNPVVARAPK